MNTPYSGGNLTGGNTTQSIDDKITEESIRRLSYEQPGFSGNDRTFLGSAAAWIAAHKLPVAIASAVVVIVVSGVAFALGNAQTSDKKTTSDDSLAVIDGESYPDSAALESETGSESNSGTGDRDNSGAAPTTPAGLSLTAAGTSINAKWNAVKAASQYAVEISRSPDMKNGRSITTGIPSAAIIGLQPSTKYYVRVAAINAADKSGWSRISITSTRALTLAESLTPLPSRITTVKASAISTSGTTVSWNRISNANRYTVKRASNSSMTLNVKEYAPTASTSYRAADLSPGNTYYFTVRPSNVRGYGQASAALRIRTYMVTPSIISLKLLSNNTIETAYKRSYGASSHEVRYGASKSFSGAKIIRSTKDKVSLTGLKPGTTYYVQVRAKDGGFTTGWSAARSMRTTVSVPRSLKASNPTTSSFKLAWGKVLGSPRYNVRYSASPSMSKSSTKTTSNTSLTVSGLKAGQRYYAQVRAFDGARWTRWSSSLRVTLPRQPITRNVRIAQANLYTGMNASDFSADLNTVMDYGPDFITLNETYNRTKTEMEKRGYLSWRSMATRDTKETPVLWRNDRWSVTGRGTKAISRSGIQHATRDANYVTLVNRNNGSRKITIISIHLIPKPSVHPARMQVMRESISNLNELIREKSKVGAVLVGGDFNIGFAFDSREKLRGFPYAGLRNTGTISTFEALGSLSGNQIDYVFYTRSSAVKPVRHFQKNLRSDHPALIADFRFMD